ncbi:MAG TPA: NAD(P)/FAD-dependent oxidoreductase, partial [Gaiella sp.]
MTTFDAVLVGSGINTLTAGALLARDGWSVCVLEQSDRLGGAIRTEQDYTMPGFTHEVMSSWHPLFQGSAAYAELADELHGRGLEYLNTELPTGTAFPDGSAMFLGTSLEANIAEFDRVAEGDGAAWQRQFEEFMTHADLSFGVLGTELWSGSGLGLGQRMFRRLGRRGLLEFAGHALGTCRDWTAATFRSEQAHGLLAPWVLHTGLGPDNAVSGFMTQVIACAVQLGGMPVPVGGGVKLVDALSGIVRDAGGELRTGAPVRRITVSSGRATGVVLADGDVISASRAVIAGVTPTQLYGALLAQPDTPAEIRDAAARYRYGRAGMQIHIAMDEPPRWKGPAADRLARTAIVHVTPGLDGVSRAVNEAERGLLPADATIVAGQPCAVDPSRAPDGKWIVWIQLQELPAGRVKGDAAGELDVGDGAWTEDLREAYADRIVARLGESIENLASATLRRIALSPADLEALNPNLVAGDIYAGSCALDQNLLWRPFAAAPGHRTTVESLWHVGASTHPGPGLGAGSGYLVAKELTK